MNRSMSLKGFPKLRARIAELGVRQGDVAVQLGIHPTLLSSILNGRRQPPADFEANVTAALDRLEAAENAAAEARERVLEQTADEPAPSTEAA